MARRLAELIAHRRGREEKVLAALQPAPRSLADLLERAYSDTPRELWPYAERSLLAHLLKPSAKAARSGRRAMARDGCGRRAGAQCEPQRVNPAYLLAGLGSVLYGGADFCGGFAARRSSALAVTFLSGFAGLAVLFLGPLFAPVSRARAT